VTAAFLRGAPPEPATSSVPASQCDRPFSLPPLFVPRPIYVLFLVNFSRLCSAPGASLVFSFKLLDVPCSCAGSDNLKGGRFIAQFRPGCPSLGQSPASAQHAIAEFSRLLVASNEPHDDSPGVVPETFTFQNRSFSGPTGVYLSLPFPSREFSSDGKDFVPFLVIIVVFLPRLKERRTHVVWLPPSICP